jgi:hypothetical protein
MTRLRLRLRLLLLLPLHFLGVEWERGAMTPVVASTAVVAAAAAELAMGVRVMEARLVGMGVVGMMTRLRVHHTHMKAG